MAALLAGHFAREEAASYAVDGIVPQAVALPGTVEEVAAVMRLAQRELERDRRLARDRVIPAQKLEATQNLSQDWQKSLGTPEQLELVRRHLPDLDKLLAPPAP